VELGRAVWGLNTLQNSTAFASGWWGIKIMQAMLLMANRPDYHTFVLYYSLVTIVIGGYLIPLCLKQPDDLFI
jgi:hypothetical protein